MGENFNFYRNLNFIKKHKEKDIWVYLLQPPKSRKNWVDESRNTRILEIEHLFEDSFFEKIGVTIPKTISPTALEWKVGNGFKEKLGKLVEVLDVSECEVEDFKNFKPLFDKIEELFKTSP